MKPRTMLLLIPIIFVILLTACWSKRELNELSVVSALGIDKHGEDYIVTAQIINPRQIAQQTLDIQTPITTYRAKGQTLFEAVRRLTLEIPRELYLSHVRTVIFGEELARDGIEKALDLLLRDHQFRADFYMMVAREEKAERVLDVLTPLEQIPGNMIYSALETSESRWGPTHAADLEELAVYLSAEGKNPVLTGIILEGSAQTGMDIENIEKVDVPTTVQIGHLAAFKGDRLVGWLNENESRGYNHIMGNTKNSVVTIPLQGGGKMAIEITGHRTDIKAVMKNGGAGIEIEARLEANVGEAQCAAELDESQVLQYIQEALEREVKGYMEAAIRSAKQDLKSDIFGFGDIVYRTYPKVWKDLSSSWEDEFIRLPVRIKVNAKIKGIGTTTQAFKKESKE